MDNTSHGKIYCKQGFANPYDCRRNPIIGCDCGFHTPMFWDKFSNVWRDLTEDNLDKAIAETKAWIYYNPTSIDGVVERWLFIRELERKKERC